MHAPSLVLVLALIAAPAWAQTRSLADHLAAGDSLTDALQPAQALEHYRAAFMQDTKSYEAMWKFARAQIDVAKQLDDDRAGVRDSLYWVASLYAEAATRTDSLDPEGHFMLSQALGRLSRTKGGRDRVRFAKQIYNEAARALELDPTHDGAHHVLGAWHAEVMRLGGMAKFFAKTFLGGGFLEKAAWDSAIVHLERAVALKPEDIFHRLELAEVYLERDRLDAARQQLDAIADLPPTGDVIDPQHKERARYLVDELSSKEGREGG